MQKITVCADRFTATIHMLYVIFGRPLMIGTVIALPIVSICLSASAITGMISSSLNPEVSCEEDLAFGIQLARNIRSAGALDALMIEFTESTDPKRNISPEEWQALLFAVDSKIEALQQECGGVEST